MSDGFDTLRLPAERSVVAPDGSDVRVLLQLAGGSMAHFALQPGLTSRAVRHRSVEELWFVTGGAGQMWRRGVDGAGAPLEEFTELSEGVCLSLPRGTTFQFRSTGTESLTAVAVTMPPWPGEGEAVPESGTWEPTVP